MESLVSLLQDTRRYLIDDMIRDAMVDANSSANIARTELLIRIERALIQVSSEFY